MDVFGDAALKLSQEVLSQNLYQVLEHAGCSTDKRNMRKLCKIYEEIISDVVCEHIWPGICSHYIFGSQYEGTSLIGMGSDEDRVFVFKGQEVVTTLQTNTEPCLLLIQDDFTPPGYCKLQLMLFGIPWTLQTINNPLLQAGLHKSYGPFNEEFFKIQSDMLGRLVGCHPLQDKILLSCKKKEFHGPAICLAGIKGRVLDADMVPAFRCRSLPKDALKWFTRKRCYGWPPKEIIDKCKKLGFLVVPVGHPNSMEPDKQWRISLSLQERMLVTLFNSMQLKCFVLMKVLKNEVINKQLNQKVLTSYHCKTCMLYMIETTPGSFWVPNNLLKCITRGVRQLRNWAKQAYCPNYFVPEENLFDKLTRNDLQQLTNTLDTLLSGNFTKVLLSLNTSTIGIGLRYLAILDDFTSVDTGDYPVEFLQRHEWKTVRGCFSPYSRETRLRERFRCQLEFITSLLDIRSIIVICMYSSDLEKVSENLRSIVNKLETEAKVTEHSEDETKTAMSLILPFVKPTYFSTKIALCLQRQSKTSEKEISNILKGDLWCESNLPIVSSSLIKKACILFSLGYNDEANDVMCSIPGGVRFSYCSCDRTKIMSGDVGGPIDVLFHRPDMVYDDVSIKDLLWKVVSPCVPFMLTEASITPPVILYECLRCLCKPAKPMTRTFEPSYEHEIAYVDGQFLNNFLLYLIHNKMQKDVTVIDILNMITLVNSRKIGHKTSCLNILGWVLRREGLNSKALQCFTNSILEVAERNAAYWHLLFLICE